MIDQLLSYDLAYALAWTLVHSIWQITFIALCLALVLRLTKRSTAQLRYIMCFGALATTVVSALVTFAIHYKTQDTSSVAMISGMTGEFTSESETNLTTLFGFIDSYLFVIVYTWILGSFLFLMKLLGSYAYIKKIAADSLMDNYLLGKKLAKLKAKYGIHRDVQLRSSSKITTPMVIGFIKPIILFPIGLVNQLTSDEVAAILAHELAHIKRHDFLFNLLQSVMESIFYFHPGIWYISNCITKERENCCDDMAIQYTGNKISYAKTLIRLQELKLHNLSPALAMAGKNGNFSHRIKRILDLPVHSNQIKEKVIAICLLSLTIVGFANESQESLGVNTDALDVYIIDDCPQDINEIKYYLDTIPERNNFHVKRSSKDSDLELKMEDGEIRKLIIDGETIPESRYDELEDVIVKLTPDGKSEMITVFPDCGEDFGNIYYFNKNMDVVNLDSILEDVSEKMNLFENYKENRFDFHADRFDNDFIDSLKKEISTIDLSVFQKDQIFDIDSLTDQRTSRNYTLIYDKPSSDHHWLLDTLDRAFSFPKTVLEKHDFSTSLIRKKNVHDEIAYSLIDDAFVSGNTKSKVELTDTYLKIDGEKQPSNIYRKYKKIFESTTGLKLNKKTKIELEVNPIEM